MVFSEIKIFLIIYMRQCLIAISVIFLFGCSSSPNLTQRPPAMLLSDETVYLAVDLQADAPTVDSELNGYPFSAVELKMICPLGREEFTATIPKQTFWTKISLGGYFFTDPNISGANLPDPWPVPQCPSNGFPISKLFYTESELNELSTVFSRPFFRRNAKKHVSSYIVYRSLLARSVDEGLACTKADRVRLSAFEARYLGRRDLEDTYHNEAIELGRACLTLTNLSSESHIQHIVAHINQLRLVGRFSEAQDAITLLRSRYSDEQINEMPGNAFNSILPTMTSVLSKLEDLIDEQESGFYVVPMRNPITASNPLLDKYRQLLSIQRSIKPVN